jgi:hypothetical protein
MAEEAPNQCYGTYGLMHSGAAFDSKKDIEFTPIGQLNESYDGKLVWIRGRLHNSRVKPKNCFIAVRNQIHTIQVRNIYQSF